MATTLFYLDTRRAKSDDTYPLKLRIGHLKLAKLYNTKYSLTKDEFAKLNSGRNMSEKLKTIKPKLDALVAKANAVIDALDPFDFNIFNSRFTETGSRTDLIFLLNEKAAEFEQDEKYGSKNLYIQTAALLSAYVNKGKAQDNGLAVLPIVMVTPKWLQDFEKWALKVTYSKKVKGSKETITESKYSRTTLGMYLIRVRAIFNEVISRKELSVNAYPFHRPDNKSGYKIPKGLNNKRALTPQQLMLIYNYEPQTEGEQFAKDIFLFSYLGSGMNTADIFRLRWSDIKDNQFSFIRKKTENKTGGTNKISVPLNNDMISIMERQGSRKINNDYIFNVIPANATELTVKNKTAIAISAINTSLKKIASKLGITEDISTYYARHTYSTTLMNQERPLAFISKQLGHKDLKTTQDYLDSFATHKAVEYHDDLIPKDKTG